MGQSRPPLPLLRLPVTGRRFSIQRSSHLLRALTNLGDVAIAVFIQLQELCTAIPGDVLGVRTSKDSYMFL